VDSQATVVGTAVLYISSKTAMCRHNLQAFRCTTVSILSSVSCNGLASRSEALTMSLTFAKPSASTASRYKSKKRTASPLAASMRKLPLAKRMPSNSRKGPFNSSTKYPGVRPSQLSTTCTKPSLSKAKAATSPSSQRSRWHLRSRSTYAATSSMHCCGSSSSW
jgi:hypothetical protein